MLIDKLSKSIRNMTPIMFLGVGVITLGVVILLSVLAYLGWHYTSRGLQYLNQLSWLDYFIPVLFAMWIIYVLVNIKTVDFWKQLWSMFGLAFTIWMVMGLKSCGEFIARQVGPGANGTSTTTTSVLPVAQGVPYVQQQPAQPVWTPIQSTPVLESTIASTPEPTITSTPMTRHPGWVWNKHTQQWQPLNDAFRATSIRFFASDKENLELDRGQRRYRNRFSAQNTQWINWELNLGHEADPNDIDFEIDAHWYDPNGHEFLHMTHPVKKSANTTESYYSQGWGSGDPAWIWKSEPNLKEPIYGQYVVELFIKNTKVGHEIFILE